MSLSALVLLAAFLLKDDDLIAKAVADDGRFYACRGSLAAREDRVDLDFLACFGVDRRNANRLAAFDRELLTAGFNDRVTHFHSLAFGRFGQANLCHTAEKFKLYGKHFRRSSFGGVLYNADEGQVPIAAGGIEAVADNELIRYHKSCIINA